MICDFGVNKFKYGPVINYQSRKVIVREKKTIFKFENSFVWKIGTFFVSVFYRWFWTFLIQQNPITNPFLHDIGTCITH